MNESSIKEKICNLLESVVDKTENINKSESPEYLIEIDLALEDLKALYNDFYLLKKLIERRIEGGSETSNNQLESTELASRTFPRKFVTPPPQRETDDSSDTSIENGLEENEEKTDSHEIASEVAPTLDDKKTSDSKTEEKDEKPSDQNREESMEQNTVSEIIGDESTAEDKKTKPDESEKSSAPNKSNNKNKAVADVVGNNQNDSIGDKFKEEDKSLNVRLAKMKQEVDIGTHMQQNPLENLKEGIGVNEKFLFINELFDGDIEAYNEAVDKLNSFENLDEAFNYINKLNEKHVWDGHHSSKTIDKFAYLVQRRYMTN